MRNNFLRITILSLVLFLWFTPSHAGQPPVAIIGDEEIHVDISEPFFINGYSSHDPDGGKLTYTWKYGTLVLGTEKSLHHFGFSYEGYQSLYFTVTDDEGLSDSILITVVVGNPPERTVVYDDEYTNSEDNTPPVAILETHFVTSEIGELFSLDSSSSYDPDSDTIQREWRYGTDIIGTGSTLEYAMEKIGKHNITLRLTDEHGAVSEANALITIISQPEPALIGVQEPKPNLENTTQKLSEEKVETVFTKIKEEVISVPQLTTTQQSTTADQTKNVEFSPEVKGTQIDESGNEEQGKPDEYNVAPNTQEQKFEDPIMPADNTTELSAEHFPNPSSPTTPKLSAKIAGTFSRFTETILRIFGKQPKPLTIEGPVSISLKDDMTTFSANKSGVRWLSGNVDVATIDEHGVLYISPKTKQGDVVVLRAYFGHQHSDILITFTQ